MYMYLHYTNVHAQTETGNISGIQHKVRDLMYFTVVVAIISNLNLFTTFIITCFL